MHTCMHACMYVSCWRCYAHLFAMHGSAHKCFALAGAPTTCFSNRGPPSLFPRFVSVLVDCTIKKVAYMQPGWMAFVSSEGCARLLL